VRSGDIHVPAVALVRLQDPDRWWFQEDVAERRLMEGSLCGLILVAVRLQHLVP
jgi:hypothetical protein